MEVRLHRWPDLGPAKQERLPRRAETGIAEKMTAAARRIIDDVRREADRAVLRHSERSGGVAGDGRGPRVGELGLESAGRGLELHQGRSAVFAGQRLAPVPAAGLPAPDLISQSGRDRG